ncbi:hypothetical protein ACQJBY_024890 [Aegilops geniculata]
MASPGDLHGVTAAGSPNKQTLKTSTSSSSSNSGSGSGSGSSSSSSSSSGSGSSRDITTSCKIQKTRSLSMRELQEITDNFCKERAIGEGAYGKVYRGALDNGKEIAVKLLHNRLDIDDGQFRRELDNLMRFEHQNIVQLVGYCYETQHKPIIGKEETIFAEEITKALCFEYMQKGSLQKHLYEESDGLDWQTRYKIIKGTCEGLQYLHEGFKKPIYHLDLKPDNILLDENMFPKLADFGLSRLFREHKTMVIESVSGTIGYMPPEYIHENAISNKFDIFSLGVAITKVIAGPSGHTRSAEMSHQEFLDQVQTNWRSRLRSTCSSHKQLKAHCHQVNICTEIALSCMEYDRHRRPDIIDIIHRLNDTEATIDRALSWSVSSQSWMQGDMVKLHTFTSKAILCGKTCNEFPVLVRITAAPWCHTEEMPRAGVDIVVVVDINMGRVSHWKLKIIKQALMTVIDKLGPNDRFSIVWFKGSVPHTMKLTFTSNKGKEIAKVVINELDGSHGNNTIAALREGVEILRGRGAEEAYDRVGCILFVSNGDGMAALKTEISSEFPVHAIGVQKHHDPEVMKYIADKTCGTYSFLDEDDSCIHEALKLFTTGITSVAARFIQITLAAHEGITVSSIESGGYKNLVGSDKQTGVIDIDNMYAGEQKNFIVYLSVGEGNKKLLTIGGQYRSLDASKRLADKDVFILRPLSECSPDKLGIHHEVAVERTRTWLMKGLSVMVEMPHPMCGEGPWNLWNSIRRPSEDHCATKETMVNLSNDVTEIERNIRDYLNIGERSYKKVPYLMSWLSCHKWQRATTKGSCYDSGAFALSQLGASEQHVGEDAEDNNN